MTKIHPQIASSPTSSKPEVFTIWMKSLVLGDHGCTVFDSNGKMVFRVDNYNKKHDDEVHLMDPKGRVVFTMRKKKLKWLGCWEGFKSATTEDSDNSRRPGFFQVRKALNILRRSSLCKVVIELGSRHKNHSQLKMEILGSKSSQKINIADVSGGIAAEVKRKVSCGVLLGEDVLEMVVEPNIDHSLVVGLVVVYSLIRHKM